MTEYALAMVKAKLALRQELVKSDEANNDIYNKNDTDKCNHDGKQKIWFQPIGKDYHKSSRQY